MDNAAQIVGKRLVQFEGIAATFNRRRGARLRAKYRMPS